VDDPVDGKHRSFDYEKPCTIKRGGKSVRVFETKNDKVFNNFLTPKPVDWDDTLKKVKRHIFDFACGDRHILVVARDVAIAPVEMWWTITVENEWMDGCCHHD
jgi:hypothetical protein